MTLAAPHGLAFQIGARTLFRVRRRLVRVGLGLDAVLAGAVPKLPPIGRDGDGYLITSLPQAVLGGVTRDGMLAFVRQRYTRYHADLTIGYDAWWAGLSGNTRSSLKRKAKRFGSLDVRRYRTPDELEAFHALARGVAAKTYQERLLGAGLPDSTNFVREMLRDGAADAVRAWLLFLDGGPVAYLYCPIHHGVVLYAYVGHDPAQAELSPGTLLHLEAMRDLFAEQRFRLFDFTEGEGQHKRAFATGGTECADVLLLRPTLANRATLAGLRGFDAGVALAKRGVARMGLKDWAKRVRRG
jgi:CelD/BcsL family acetyltransferase involved in cellulose biosynthesis